MSAFECHSEQPKATKNLPRSRRYGRFFAALSMTCVGVAFVLAACGSQPAFTIPSADPARGKQAIVAYGCGACHVVPGVTGARGMAGPPLTSWAQRGIIAGHLANTPDNLVAWIVDPPKYSPGTAMPRLGVSDAQARDIAAYLYTLR